MPDVLRPWLESNPFSNLTLLHLRASDSMHYFDIAYMFDGWLKIILREQRILPEEEEDLWRTNGSEEEDIQTSAHDMSRMPGQYDYFALFTLAEWAFSPSGLPKLQHIAVGDFSRGRTYRETHCILSRHWLGHWEWPESCEWLRRSESCSFVLWQRSFSMSAKNDEYLRHICNRLPIDILGACPRRPIVRSYKPWLTWPGRS